MCRHSINLIGFGQKFSGVNFQWKFSKFNLKLRETREGDLNGGIQQNQCKSPLVIVWRVHKSSTIIIKIFSFDNFQSRYAPTIQREKRKKSRERGKVRRKK